jgi:hypothetical protein
MTNSSKTPPTKSQSPQSKGWSPERRAKHAAAIRKWAPWAKSTGPKTRGGKYISSRNSLKHGMRARPMIELFKALTLQRLWLNEIREREKFKITKRTIEAKQRRHIKTPEIMQKSCFLRPSSYKS